MNIVEIEEAVSAIAEKPFDPDTFFFELAAAYDAAPVTIARLKKGDTGQSDVNGAIIWQPKIHFFHSRLSAQVGLDTLAGSKKGAKAKVRFLLATDGEEIGIEDREKNERTYFKLSEFGDHFGKRPLAAGEVEWPQCGAKTTLSHRGASLHPHPSHREKVGVELLFQRSSYQLWKKNFQPQSFTMLAARSVTLRSGTTRNMRIATACLSGSTI